MKKNQILALSVAFVILISNISMINAATRQYNNTMQYNPDILIVQVGDDSIIDETGNIIANSIADRNKGKLVQYANDIKSLSNQTEFSTQYQHMNLNQIARKNFLLHTTRINVSISDLNNNVLTDYKEKILIIVAHGSQSGLSDEKQLMKWISVRNLILNQSSALTILDSCYGKNATYGIQNAIGFSNEIDNRVAAYFTLSVIFKATGEQQISQTYYYQAIQRYVITAQITEKAQFLGFITGGDDGGSGGSSGSGSTSTSYWNKTPHLGESEIIWGSIGIGYILTMIILMGISISKNTVIKATLSWVKAKGIVSLSYLIYKTVDFHNGNVSVSSFVMSIIGTIILFLTYLLAAFSVVEWLLAGAIVSLEIATEGASTIIAIITGIYLLIDAALLYESIRRDWNDLDTSATILW
ncbi:MAG: hypothetical protein ACTSXK_17480 [Promethearchaeota archaeon]